MENTFEKADKVIGKVYPDTAQKGPGWWGEQRIPNYGILRGAIERAVREAYIEGSESHHQSI